MDEMNILQTVAILIDGNNMDKSVKTANADGEFVIMMDYDRLVPRLVGRRSLSRLFYLREGTSISKKLADRLHNKFYGIVKPCHKSADVPLAIEAVQLVDKVDTIIILSGDADYLELVKYLSSRGCRTEIAAFAPSTSRVLMEAADFYHEITTDDCFVTNERKPVATPPVPANANAQVPAPVKKSKKSKPKKFNIVASDTRIVDTKNPSRTGRVDSYDTSSKSYVVIFDDGSTIKLKRNAFDLAPTIAVDTLPSIDTPQQPNT